MIKVEMTPDDLLAIIGALLKTQVNRGVKDDKIMDLVSRLSFQAINNEELMDKIRNK